MSDDLMRDVSREERAERRPPPRSVVRDLAWGLATAGISFLAFGLAFGLTNSITGELREPGPQQFGPKGKVEDGPDVVLAALTATSCLGFPLLAAVVVTLRTPWWVGFAAGAILGSVIAGLIHARAEELDAGICLAIAVGWAGAGLAGGVISGLRRCYRI